jgi:glycosyltransferase involved in cell wall biosynthesis
MSGAPVLIVSYSGLFGGAERVLVDCASAARESRADEPVVACPDGPLAAAVRAAGLAHVRLPERPLRLRGARIAHARDLAALARDIAALDRRHRPRALVAWGARAVLAAALVPRGRRAPLLAVHHDLPPSRAVATAVRAATRRADGVAAASEAIARAVAPGAGAATRRAVAPGAGAVTVLHPGVDLAAFAPAPLPDRQPPRALVLGALVAWKRPDLALEVAARMPELRLEIAGAPIGDDRIVRALELRARAADLLGRVTFLGGVADPRPALARAHVLLHCADAEPYGLALVEALASGRPVVAADAAGPREIVADGAGRLFAPGDPDAAATALREVLADPDAPAAARAHAERRFSVDASAARFAAALEALEAPG